MTDAYDLFTRELHAQGRERMDGFSLGNLARLTATERSEVRQHLEQCLLQGDERAPIALVVLDPSPDTEARLASLMKLPRADGLEADNFTVEVAAALAVMGPEPQAMDLLDDVLSSGADIWRRGIAREGMRRAHANSDASARLARQIRSADQLNHRLDCADALLQRHGWKLEDPARADETLQLLRDLAGADAGRRDAALLLVLKAPIQPWPVISP